MVLRQPVIGIVALLAIAPAAAPAWAEDFETRLAPSPLTDRTRINITGEGRAKASLNGRTLTVGGDFQGLATPATTAEIYDGLGIAIPGPKAFDLTVSQAVWQTRLPTSVQGYVVSYAVDGKQYIAVESGLGGGSPVGKPTTLLPNVHHPNNGNAIFVFALPDND